MKNDSGVRSVSVYEKMGYENPNAILVQASHAAAERARADLNATLERMVRERAGLAKNPKANAKYIARYDEIIANIRGTLTGSTARQYCINYRTR